MSLPHLNCSSDSAAGRPSTWFTWHQHLIAPGARVLDLACGTGRHSLAAAQRGARVTAVDADMERLETGRREAARLHLDITWLKHDLESPLAVAEPFDVVLQFNFLDRQRMPSLLAHLAPGGTLVMETFLEAQRRLGWGPERDEFLLHPGELGKLIAPLTIVFGREALEPLPGDRWQAVTSIVARKPRIAR